MKKNPANNNLANPLNNIEFLHESSKAIVQQKEIPIKFYKFIKNAKTSCSLVKKDIVQKLNDLNSKVDKFKNYNKWHIHPQKRFTQIKTSFIEKFLKESKFIQI